MDNTVCPHCGAPLKHDKGGKIVYLRAYTCGSFGSLAEQSEFSQSVSCMQAQIKRLQRINGELLDRQHDLGKQIFMLQKRNESFAQAIDQRNHIITSQNEQLTTAEFYRGLCQALTKRIARLKEQRNAARTAFHELIKAIYAKE